MTLLRNIAILIVVLVTVLFFLNQYQEKNPTPVVISSPPSTVNRQPVAAPQQFAPAPVQLQASSSRRAEVENGAKSARVKITSWKETGSTIDVRVEWSSDNAAQGGDFLDAMIRLGMRDFDELGKGQGMVSNRRVFHATYRLKF